MHVRGTIGLISGQYTYDKINCHRLFLLASVNEMILLVACSYLHVELHSFIIVVYLGEKSNKAEVFFFFFPEVMWILIFLFLEERVILKLNYFLFVYVPEKKHTISSKHFINILASSSQFWLPQLVSTFKAWASHHLKHILLLSWF